MTPDMVSDEDLVRAIPRDERAFSQFYRRHFSEVVGFLVRRTGDPELAAELTAEVFATVLLQAGRFDPTRGSARTWLFTIARRTQIDAWRRGQADLAACRRLGLERVRASAEDLEDIKALGRAIEAEMLQLPADQRVAVHGRLVEDLTYEELARRSDVSPAAIRQRVSRGLATLRSRLEER